MFDNGTEASKEVPEALRSCIVCLQFMAGFASMKLSKPTLQLLDGFSIEQNRRSRCRIRSH